MTMITIAPELRELPHYQLADLLELQGELKDLTERNAAKLRRSITKHGLFVPFFVWPAPDGNTYILDGHQRKRTLVKDGHGSLPVPCVLVHADTLPEAKEKLLVISSQYGRITQEGFDEFTFDLPDVGELVHFDAIYFGFGGEGNDPTEEWRGMPEFEQEDLTAFRSIHIHFKNQEDVDRFAERIGQKLTDKTRSIWYPVAEKTNMRDYYDES